MDQKGFSLDSLVVALLATASAIYFLVIPGKNEEAAKLAIVAGFAFLASLLYGALAFLQARKWRRPR